MIKKHTLLTGLLAVSVLLVSCGPRTPSPEVLIRQSVAATLNAIPTPTRGAMPPTPYPSPTPFSLAGLFCEYQFCIGHPQDMAFLDGSAQQNPNAPSTYSQGLLAAYNASLVIELVWQIAPGVTDPQFMMDLIFKKDYDTRSGDMTTKLIRNMNVLYTPIATTASSLVPFGGVGAWTCGDRVFAWKIYTSDSGSAEALFNDALNRFTCNQ